MKKITSLLMGLISIIAFVNSFDTDSKTAEKRNQQEINFSGTLITQQDEKYPVDNIAIGRRYERIDLYDRAPIYKANTTNNQYSVPSDDTSSNAIMGRKIKKNPKKGIITPISLSDVHEIRVPNPDIIWIYQAPKNSRKIEYIEIVVVYHNNQQPKQEQPSTAHYQESTYLIDLDRKLTCNTLSPAEGEKIIPFDALKNITIEGCRHRDTDVPCKKRNPKGEKE